MRNGETFFFKSRRTNKTHETSGPFRAIISYHCSNGPYVCVFNENNGNRIVLWTNWAVVIHMLMIWSIMQRRLTQTRPPKSMITAHFQNKLNENGCVRALFSISIVRQFDCLTKMNPCDFWDSDFRWYHISFSFTASRRKNTHFWGVIFNLHLEIGIEWNFIYPNPFHNDPADRTDIPLLPRSIGKNGLICLLLLWLCFSTLLLNLWASLKCLAYVNKDVIMFIAIQRLIFGALVTLLALK